MKCWLAPIGSTGTHHRKLDRVRTRRRVRNHTHTRRLPYLQTYVALATEPRRGLAPANLPWARWIGAPMSPAGDRSVGCAANHIPAVVPIGFSHFLGCRQISRTDAERLGQRPNGARPRRGAAGLEAGDGQI